MKPEEYATRIEHVGAWQYRVTTYRLDDAYVCAVDNVDPGATLARVKAASLEEAVAQATSKARHMLEKTRVVEN